MTKKICVSSETTNWLVNQATVVFVCPMNTLKIMQKIWELISYDLITKFLVT